MYIVLASSRLYSYWRQAITGDDDDDDVQEETNIYTDFSVSVTHRKHHAVL